MDRNDGFREFMAAHQRSLMRTAYLLTRLQTVSRLWQTSTAGNARTVGVAGRWVIGRGASCRGSP